jgi:hypothetical protein
VNDGLYLITTLREGVMPSDARRNECALPGEIPKVGFWPNSEIYEPPQSTHCGLSRM